MEWIFIVCIAVVLWMIEKHFNEIEREIKALKDKVDHLGKEVNEVIYNSKINHSSL
ncbi:MAG: hypothetical protein HQ572_02355 [Candidatus Omnitrophica bacterium]|nr:hypothetical protein [Candidatus Omnitrophota bacterium]